MMTSTSMDETMSETEPATEAAPVLAADAPEPVPAAEFDATPWPLPSRPAPRAPRVSSPLGPRIWTAALARAPVFTAAGLTLLYLSAVGEGGRMHRQRGGAHQLVHAPLGRGDYGDERHCRQLRLPQSRGLRRLFERLHDHREQRDRDAECERELQPSLDLDWGLRLAQSKNSLNWLRRGAKLG